jgi:hypothetical protein
MTRIYMAWCSVPLALVSVLHVHPARQVKVRGMITLITHQVLHSMARMPLLFLLAYAHSNGQATCDWQLHTTHWHGSLVCIRLGQ